LSSDNQVIKDFEISKRINEAATSFNVTFITPLSPEEYDTGSEFQFIIDDPTLNDGFVAIDGIVGPVGRDKLNGNKIYSIEGYDSGRILQKQPFALNCTESGVENYTVLQLLNLILTDTGISIGRGENFNKLIVLNTSSESLDRFCGSWNTKEEAINSLFRQYSDLSGTKRIRWYIDNNGTFRWFELSSTRPEKEYIFSTDKRINAYKAKKDPDNIINSITGFYGPQEDDTSITLTDEDSIDRYGLCVGEPITEESMTYDQMENKLENELDQKAWPIWTVELELKGYYSYEPGMLIEFPDDDEYSSKTFTVTDISYKGELGITTTSLSLTTDESAVSIPNEFDTVEAIAKKVDKDSRAEVMIVESVGPGDRLRALSYSPGGQISKNVRNVGGNWR
jgi:hypothetical protein